MSNLPIEPTIDWKPDRTRARGLHGRVKGVKDTGYRVYNVRGMWWYYADHDRLWIGRGGSKSAACADCEAHARRTVQLPQPNEPYKSLRGAWVLESYREE